MNNEKILNIDLQYFANVYWYKKASNYTHIKINKYELHSKMSFRNRLWISGADGRMNLSIPIVDGRNEKQFYKDIRIVPGRWQMIHFRALVSCYNRSPWFEHYRDELAGLYETPFMYLWDWNLACHNWVCSKIPFSAQWDYQGRAGWGGQNTRNGRSPEGENSWEEGGELGGNAADYRNYFKPSNEEAWIENGGKPICYTQVFEERTGFISGLSILDLLFCAGPGLLKKLV